MITRSLFRQVFGAALALVWLGALPLFGLQLHRERALPTDLAVAGRLTGVPAGETRYVRWADLRALPSIFKMKLDGEFVKGEQEVTALWLADVWAALFKEADADVLLATCTDGYAAVYRPEFIKTYRPILVLEINGEGPDKWPPPGLNFNPGPYVITVSKDIVPAVESYLDVGHKKPWGTNVIEVANYAERFKGAYTGNWAGLSARAEAGRELYIHSCTSCHGGPDKMFGGTKSGRVFEVLVAHATHNPEYFKKYVRAPKSVMPLATMQAHPDYTDEQLAAVMAFVVAEKK
jgi:mono/diheme cytochrome c family protein